jgi:SLT domain-containing protein
MLAQMNTESSGNPNAIQTTDINAQRGDPSKGLLQVIGSTFRDTLNRHGHPELIPAGQYDPWANMIAAIYYTVDKFGSLAKWNAAIGGNPNPYDNGGMLPVGWSQVYNGTASPEAVMTDRQWSIASRAMNHVIGGGNGGGGNYTINARVFVGNREITDIARVEAEVVMDNGFTEFANQVNRQRVQAT